MKPIEFQPTCAVTGCNKNAWAWCWAHGVKRVPLCRVGWREFKHEIRKMRKVPRRERIHFGALPFRGHPSERSVNDKDPA